MGSSTRRNFIHSAIGAGATVGVGSLIAACADAGASGATATTSAALAGAAGKVNTAAMPYRQDDPRWGRQLMWDRKLVIKADMTLNHQSRADASSLLYPYADGNTIANEGCMLSCLAMVMKMLAPPAKPAWTPGTLNRSAHDAYYYTLSGLSMVTLYPDLVSEMTEGAVQLAISEDYLPGVSPWKPTFANSSPLVRAYRSLTPAQRSNFLVMIKTGTYDDTAASHYSLLHPNASQSPDSSDAQILDPAQPIDDRGPWKLTDSAKWINQDPQIEAAWREGDIKFDQIAGAWVFARWNRSGGRPLIAPLVRAWADQLS